MSDTKILMNMYIQNYLSTCLILLYSNVKTRPHVCTLHVHVHAASLMRMCSDLLTHLSDSELKRGANASSSDSSKPCQQRRINHIKKKSLWCTCMCPCRTVRVYTCTKYNVQCTCTYMFIYRHVPLQRAEPHCTYQLSTMHTNGRDTLPHTSLYTYIHRGGKKEEN